MNPINDILNDLRRLRPLVEASRERAYQTIFNDIVNGVKALEEEGQSSDRRMPRRDDANWQRQARDMKMFIRQQERARGQEFEKICSKYHKRPTFEVEI